MKRLPRPAALAAPAVALLALVGVAGCSATDTGSGTPTTVASSSSGSKGTGAAGSPSTTAGKAGPSLADEELGGYRFQVLSAEVLDDRAALLPPSAGNVVVGITVSMTNVSDQDQPVSTLSLIHI